MKLSVECVLLSVVLILKLFCVLLCIVSWIWLLGLVMIIDMIFILCCGFLVSVKWVILVVMLSVRVILKFFLWCVWLDYWLLLYCVFW